MPFADNFERFLVDTALPPGGELVNDEFGDVELVVVVEVEAVMHSRALRALAASQSKSPTIKCPPLGTTAKLFWAVCCNQLATDGSSAMVMVIAPFWTGCSSVMARRLGLVELSLTTSPTSAVQSVPSASIVILRPFLAFSTVKAWLSSLRMA